MQIILLSNKRAYILYGLTALIAIWYWHPDEHYQIFEFASYKLGYTANLDLAWEYNSHLRSSFLPFFAFIICKILLGLHVFHPFLAEAICRIIAASFFIYVYQKLLPILLEKIENSEYKKNIYTIALFFFILPVVMIRFSSESISASLFWLGYLKIIANKKEFSFREYLFVGLIWGIAFYIRMHIAILITIVLIWILIKDKKIIKIFSSLFLGFILASGIEIILNYWMYHEFIWSPYQYFVVNMVQGVADKFGVSPWYYYIELLVRYLLIPFSWFLIVGLGIYLWKNWKELNSHLLIGFIIIHSAIAHKELRFLFPIFHLMIPMMLIGITVYTPEFRYKVKLLKIFLFINSIFFLNAYIIQSFRSFNQWRLYPYTIENKKIAFLQKDIYQLDSTELSRKVKAHFYKHPECRTELFLTKEEIPTSIPLIVTNSYLGEEFINSKRKYKKVFQTISPTLETLLPEIILMTVDYSYFYQLEMDK